MISKLKKVLYEIKEFIMYIDKKIESKNPYIEDEMYFWKNNRYK